LQHGELSQNEWGWAERFRPEALTHEAQPARNGGERGGSVQRGAGWGGASGPADGGAVAAARRNPVDSGAGALSPAVQIPYMLTFL
jgi:hypothetical protein